MKPFLFLLALGLCALPAPLQAQPAPSPEASQPAVETFSNPAMETRARNLQRQFRCLVCQGESIDESRSDFAADMRHLVRQQMAAGRSDSQIADYLKTRYGNFILMKPPLETDTAFLWAAPFLVLILAGGVAIFVIRKAGKAVAPPDL